MTRSLIATGGTRMLFAAPMPVSPAVVTWVRRLAGWLGRTRSHRLGLAFG